MTLGELFAGIANAIRFKDGTTAAIPATTFPERIMAISGGGGGGGDGSPYVVNVPVTISARVSVTAEKWYTHHLYNGVRLPTIPFGMLASYPYAWIRKNTSTRYYDLFLSTVPFYTVSSTTISGSGITKPWYRVSIASADSATSWTSNGTSSANLTYDRARTVMWSNHDIPSGSATSTTIYFEGTDPVPTD